VLLAVASFLALSVFSIPFPVVISAAAATGWLIGRVRPDALQSKTPARTPDTDETPPLIPDDVLHAERPTARRSATVLAIGIAVWGLPLLAVALLTGTDSVFTTQGMFFTGTALVTFGGAYAVLAYVAQRAVEVFGWLAPGEMVRGLALAETTPGPLIMVVQFVAFVGAFRNPGGLDPWLAGTLGALITTWVTFVPCFVFVFLGAPYIEQLRNNKALSAALTGLTAAVVGVIANLALYFAFHTLFATTTALHWGPINLELPNLSTWQPVSTAITIVALILVFAVKWSVLRTLAVCAALGAAAALTGLPLP
jgi:chromate transporter